MRILDEIERRTRPTSALAQIGCMIAAGGMIGATVTNSVGGALGGAVTIGCYPFMIANHRRILLAATVFAAHKAAADYLLQNHSFLPICTALASGFLFGTRQVQEVVTTAATAKASTYLPTAISFVANNYLREAATIASIALEVYGISKIGYLLPQLIQGDRRQTLRNIGLHWMIASASALKTQHLYNPNKVAHWTVLAVVALVSMAVSARALYLARAYINPNPVPPQPAPVQGPPPRHRDNAEPNPPRPRVDIIQRRPPPPQQLQPVIVRAPNVDELAEQEHRNAELDRLRAELDRVSAQIRDSSSNEGFGRLYAEFDRLNAQLNRLNALPPLPPQPVQGPAPPPSKENIRIIRRRSSSQPVRPDPDDNPIRDSEALIAQLNAETNRLAQLIAENKRLNADYARNNAMRQGNNAETNQLNAAHARNNAVLQANNAMRQGNNAALRPHFSDDDEDTLPPLLRRRFSLDGPPRQQDNAELNSPPQRRYGLIGLRRRSPPLEQPQAVVGRDAEHARRKAELKSLHALVRSDSSPNFSDEEDALSPPPRRRFSLDGAPRQQDNAEPNPPSNPVRIVQRHLRHPPQPPLDHAQNLVDQIMGKSRRLIEGSPSLSPQPAPGSAPQFDLSPIRPLSPQPVPQQEPPSLHREDAESTPSSRRVVQIQDRPPPPQQPRRVIRRAPPALNPHEENNQFQALNAEHARRNAVHQANNADQSSLNEGYRELQLQHAIMAEQLKELFENEQRGQEEFLELARQNFNDYKSNVQEICSHMIVKMDERNAKDIENVRKATMRILLEFEMMTTATIEMTRENEEKVQEDKELRQEKLLFEEEKRKLAELREQYEAHVLEASKKNMAVRVIPRISFDYGIPAELENDPIFSLFINDTTKRPICFELYFDGIDIREARGVQNHNMRQLPAVKALIEAQKRSYNGQERPSPAILDAALVELQRIFPAFPNLDKLQQLIVLQKNSAEVVLSFEKGIPQELENDMIFCLFECPITGAPICEFSLDPTQEKGKTLYERKLLEVWANKHHTSPTTRLPLESSEVIRLPKLTELISDRIRFYKAKKFTQAEIEIMLNTPPDLARLQEALSELQQHGIEDPGLQAIIDKK